MRAARLTILSLMTLAAGCHESHPRVAADVPAAATTGPSMPANSSIKTFVDTVSGVSIEYPATWTQGRGKTAVFEADSPDHLAKLSLDVPNLPFHLPGMITPSAVANGYINDFKKRSSSATVAQNEPITVPDGSARRVKITTTDGGNTTTDMAVCIVHADKVFILSSDGTGAGVDVARNALDAAVRSIKWSK